MRASLFFTLCVLITVPALADELRVVGNRLFVPLVINGTAAEALLDSGAELTLVDDDFAERLGLRLAGGDVARGSGAGTAAVRFAEGVSIDSVGVSLTDLTVAVMDLADISARLVGERVDVVLGRELFDSGRFRLDIGAGELHSISRAQTPAGTRLALTDHAGIKQMPVQVDGAPVAADFDLGNGSDVMIGRAFAADLGFLQPEHRIGTKAGGGIGGEVVRDLVRVPSLTIAGRRFEDVTAAVDATDGAVPVNVGVALLRHFVLTIDFPENALWLEAQP